MHQHSFHIAIIAMEVLVFFFLVFRKKLSFSFLIVLLLIFSLGFYSSSSRLLFAHHHESSSQSGDHPCCQPATANFVPTIELKVERGLFTYTTERGISLVPASVIDNRSIRAPPNITS
jgi:hypothetical protein